MGLTELCEQCRKDMVEQRFAPTPTFPIPQWMHCHHSEGQVKCSGCEGWHPTRIEYIHVHTQEESKQCKFCPECGKKLGV